MRVRACVCVCVCVHACVLTIALLKCKSGLLAATRSFSWEIQDHSHTECTEFVEIDFVFENYTLFITCTNKIIIHCMLNPMNIPPSIYVDSPPPPPPVAALIVDILQEEKSYL